LSVIVLAHFQQTKHTNIHIQHGNHFSIFRVWDEKGGGILPQRVSRMQGSGYEVTTAVMETAVSIGKFSKEMMEPRKMYTGIMMLRYVGVSVPPPMKISPQLLDK
jgi:hypothetical protein